MKKIYTLVAACAIAGTINAQTIINFENHALSGAESHDNGNDGIGAFDFNGTTFDYSYNMTGDYFSGFAISNHTDITTPGWMNQYSAYPGSGANGSSNFAIFYDFSNGGINTNSALVRIDSFALTNTTYTYLSMRDGDGYGKQFGSIYDGGGAVDGTNGEDFFSVWIFGENYNQTAIDSIEFFLADYRFANDSLDYIIDDWNLIDLTGFSFDVSSVRFAFTSSDVNSFGIKTPVYIALDNVSTQSVNGIDTHVVQDYDVYPNPVRDILNVSGGDGKIIITSATGQVITELSHHQFTSINVETIDSGVYFITLLTENSRSTKQFIK